MSETIQGTGKVNTYNWCTKSTRVSFSRTSGLHSEALELKSKEEEIVPTSIKPVFETVHLSPSPSEELPISCISETSIPDVES